MFHDPLSIPVSSVPAVPRWRLARRFACAAAVSSLFALGSADAAEPPSGDKAYQPEVGQEGKDVVWVPTPQSLVDKMLDIAKVTPRDKLLDLGSGDGRTVITAAKRGLVARGIEYNPQMADLARRNADQAGVSDRATFWTGDLFEADLSGADVVTMFLLPSINDRLRPRILDMKPGTRVVSNSFPMGDWKPDQSETVRENCTIYCTALLWIVPAKVAGNWRLGGQDLVLTQQFQMVSGKLGTAEISDGRLEGEKISFSVNGTRYTGTVNGSTMKGTASGKAGNNWSASRS